MFVIAVCVIFLSQSDLFIIKQRKNLLTVSVLGIPSKKAFCRGFKFGHENEEVT